MKVVLHGIQTVAISLPWKMAPRRVTLSSTVVFCGSKLVGLEWEEPEDDEDADEEE
jgi:hypothetical protein